MIMLLKKIEQDEKLHINLGKIKTDYKRMQYLTSVRKKNEYNPKEQQKLTFKLIRARKYLDSMLVILKSFFEPERNKYIEDIDKTHNSYKGMVSYMGVANARLDLIQEEFKRMENISVQQKIDVVPPVSVYLFRELLIQYAENFVLGALVRAYQKFSKFNPEDFPNKEGKIIVKDRLLFSYFLFLEFYRVSDYFGNLARQIAFSGGANKLKTLETGSGNSQAPPSLPSNVQYQEIADNQELIGDLVNDPFKELENELQF